MPQDDTDTVVIDDAASTQPGNDVEMAEDGDLTRAPEADDAVKDGEDAPAEQPTRTSFLAYLSSPIVTLVVGQDDSQSLLTAHQGLLAKSPYFADICRQFVDDGSVSTFFLSSFSPFQELHQKRGHWR